jgi:hypothetical protein
MVKTWERRAGESRRRQHEVPILPVESLGYVNRSFKVASEVFQFFRCGIGREPRHAVIANESPDERFRGRGAAAIVLYDFNELPNKFTVMFI